MFVSQIFNKILQDIGPRILGQVLSVFLSVPSQPARRLEESKVKHMNKERIRTKKGKHVELCKK